MHEWVLRFAGFFVAFTHDGKMILRSDGKVFLMMVWKERFFVGKSGKLYKSNHIRRSYHLVEGSFMERWCQFLEHDSACHTRLAWLACHRRFSFESNMSFDNR